MPWQNSQTTTFADITVPNFAVYSPELKPMCTAWRVSVAIDAIRSNSV